ncbi:MAG: 4-phosphoerythronate dehydrogenase [Gammaproteobacteria bacterium]|nr:4-phosphoerythronate dehydrogenase [Gammaproteobacteria bacterium]
MNILIDENIPYADEFFADMGTVTRFPGRELKAEQLIDADILLVRSITKVNESLLSKASKLKFVGTATIGEDHIDKACLASRDIEFSSAPGCNAVSVAEYVMSAIYVLAQKYHFNLSGKKVAIIGVGNTGKGVKNKLDALGIETLLVDPPRAKAEGLQGFVDLDYALRNADIVTCHTPLIREGETPTMHLINEEKLKLLKQDVCLINACRGEVIDNQALFNHIQERQVNDQPAIKLVLDVWENEPNPMQSLIPLADITTAHIAGYSLEGKARGTEMLYQKVCALLGHSANKSLSDYLPEPQFGEVQLDAELAVDSLTPLVHLVYDVRRDDALFRNLLNEKGFDWLRKNYPVRREWSSLKVKPLSTGENQLDFSKIGFDV